MHTEIIEEPKDLSLYKTISIITFDEPDENLIKETLYQMMDTAIDHIIVISDNPKTIEYSDRYGADTISDDVEKNVFKLVRDVLFEVEGKSNKFYDYIFFIDVRTPMDYKSMIKKVSSFTTDVVVSMNKGDIGFHVGPPIMAFRRELFTQLKNPTGNIEDIMKLNMSIGALINY